MIAKTNTQYYQNIANSIRYSKDSSQYESDLIQEKNKINQMNEDIAAAYDKAEAKGATLPAVENSANLAETVASIPTGTAPILITKQITENGTYTAAQDGADGYSEVTVAVPAPAPVKEKDVNFYDYDGTVLHAYTAQEAIALTEMPEAPIHEGLTFQEWNWTLTQLQAYVTDYGIGDAGAIYITDDGVTRLYLEVGEDVSLDYELYVQIANGTLSVEVDGVELGSATGTTGSYVNYTIPFTLLNCGNVRVDLKFTGTGEFRIGQGALRTRIFGWNSDQNDTLVKVEFGNNVTSIGASAFYGCSLLNSVVIPDSVTSVENNAFQGCSSLKSVVIPASVMSVRLSAFYGCSLLNSVVIPDSVTRIDNSTFSMCTSLNSVAIPNNVKGIGISAFYGCSLLNSVVIPDSVTQISSYAFQNCSSLKSVVIPDSVTQIADNMFRSCTSLNSVAIPNSVAKIGGAAFYGCTFLLFFDISQYTDPNNLPTFSSSNFLGDTPEDQIIYVANEEMLTAFSSATNISVYANRMKIKGAE